MREIKFRAWDIRDERMMYRTVWDRNWYATRENDNDGCHTIREITPRDDNRVELMQYIGEKDKNGVEIYEGDILKAHGEVVWNQDEFRWSCVDLTWNDKREWHDLDYLTSAFEVIGNIYEK